MDLGIAGRTAAVAASSAGLGFASARALAREGVSVVLCGRDAGRVEDAAARIAAEVGDPDRAVAVVADVSSPEGATGFVASATEVLGGAPDILVTNAGGPPPGGFADTPLEAYAPAIDLNLLSVVAMCRAAVPAMRDKGWGRVVAITSITVREPSAVLILSNTARAGATAFLKTLAREVAGDGVTVNSVQPGLHDTDRLRQLHGGDVASAGRGIPTGRVGDADDFGSAVAWLCSQQARFVTGAALPLDGGAHAGLQ